MECEFEIGICMKSLHTFVIHRLETLLDNIHDIHKVGKFIALQVSATAKISPFAEAFDVRDEFLLSLFQFVPITVFAGST